MDNSVQRFIINGLQLHDIYATVSSKNPYKSSVILHQIYSVIVFFSTCAVRIADIIKEISTTDMFSLQSGTGSCGEENAETSTTLHCTCILIILTHYTYGKQWVSFQPSRMLAFIREH